MPDHVLLHEREFELGQLAQGVLDVEADRAAPRLTLHRNGGTAVATALSGEAEIARTELDLDRGELKLRLRREGSRIWAGGDDPGALQWELASPSTPVRLGFEAAFNRDYPVMFGTLFFFSLLGLVMSLIGDIMYTVIDPRIDFEAREV